MFNNAPVQKQPKGLFHLSSTQMAESFSYHGMRVLLVLFLVSHLKYTEEEACSIYALYTALVELGAFAGGYVADRYLGLRSAVLMGGMCIGIGHLTLSLSNTPEVFFVGLGAIVCGACLFRSNLKAIVGCLYGPGDARRTPGFMLFYSASNLGGFCAALLCGALAAIYGPHAGFGLAALGMALSLTIFLKKSNQADASKPLDLIDLKVIPVVVIITLIIGSILYHFRLFQPLIVTLTCFCFFIVLFAIRSKLEENRTFVQMCVLLGLLIVYFFFEELNGSFLMLFCEKHVNRHIFGLTIPSAFLAATNPLTIILIGPLLSYGLRRARIPLFFQCSLAFLCLSISLLILYISSQGSPNSVSTIASFAAVAIGELFLAPAVYSIFSENATQKTEGLFMGTVTMAYAVAKLGSGFVGRLYSPNDVPSLAIFFEHSAILAGLIFIGLCIISLKTRKDLSSISSTRIRMPN